jgi:hypothetical protein
MTSYTGPLAGGLTFILRFADEPDWDGPLRRVPSQKRCFQGVLHCSALKTGFAFVPPSLSEKGSRNFPGRRW